MPKGKVVVYTSSQEGSDSYDQSWLESFSVKVYRDRTRILLPTPRVISKLRAVIRSEGIETIWFGAAAPLALSSRWLRIAGVNRRERLPRAGAGGHRAGARRWHKPRLRTGRRYRQIRGIRERINLARGHVERTDGTAQNDPSDDFCHIIHGDVIATFLAVSEQGDGLPCPRLANESVRPVAVMRISVAIDERRPENGQWRNPGRCEGDLTGKMHGAVEASRSCRRTFRKRDRLIPIDGIRTDIDQVRNLDALHRVEHGPHHLHVVDQHVDVLARRPVGGRNNGIAISQLVCQTRSGTVGGQVDVGPAEAQHLRTVPSQSGSARPAHKSCCTDHHHALRLRRNVECMLKHPAVPASIRPCPAYDTRRLLSQPVFHQAPQRDR
mgnify:CR=1 FL=1